MADFKLFDINPLNPNPDLSKRIAFGTAASEENMTIAQFIELVSPTNTAWTQLGVSGSWDNYSIGGMRSGIYYRINKSGQLEIDISVRYPAVAYNPQLATLPNGFRPLFPKVIHSHVGTDIFTASPCWINIETNGLISVNLLTEFEPPFYFNQSLIIPLT